MWSELCPWNRQPNLRRRRSVLHLLKHLHLKRVILTPSFASAEAPSVQGRVQKILLTSVFVRTSAKSQQVGRGHVRNSREYRTRMRSGDFFKVSKRPTFLTRRRSSLFFPGETLSTSLCRPDLQKKIFKAKGRATTVLPSSPAPYNETCVVHDESKEREEEEESPRRKTPLKKRTVHLPLRKLLLLGRT